ncbi:hypothetical protein I3842_Q094200 [Carya illinoinensis]|uniref:Uncharacterized protein n=1 Tax=Carya illinoinensis TaxID=32201 RepID=A0A922D078_CARIL|nr:hypothetical protein I3842_Q094200 [Carya illinoinensis]
MADSCFTTNGQLVKEGRQSHSFLTNLSLSLLSLSLSLSEAHEPSSLPKPQDPSTSPKVQTFYYPEDYSPTSHDDRSGSAISGIDFSRFLGHRFFHVVMRINPIVGLMQSSISLIAWTWA